MIDDDGGGGGLSGCRHCFTEGLLKKIRPLLIKHLYAKHAFGCTASVV